LTEINAARSLLSAYDIPCAKRPRTAIADSRQLQFPGRVWRRDDILFS
jgi:hypothetical protein